MATKPTEQTRKRRSRAGRKPHAVNLSRKMPSQDRAKRTLAGIIAAAEDILAKHGIDALTMRKIAATAGVSVGVTYEYFPSKQAVLYRVYESRLELQLRFFDVALSGQGLNEPFVKAFGKYLELQKQAGFPSRLDLELKNAIDRDEELARMTRHYEDALSRRYVSLLRHYGSDWPDDRLMQLAKFGHEVDHANLKLQSKARPGNRGFYGELTTEFFYFLVRYCGASTGR